MRGCTNNTGPANIRLTTDDGYIVEGRVRNFKIDYVGPEYYSTSIYDTYDSTDNRCTFEGEFLEDSAGTMFTVRENFVEVERSLTLPPNLDIVDVQSILERASVDDQACVETHAGGTTYTWKDKFVKHDW